MKIVSQPKGSYVCGQCCIAMIRGITLEQAIEYIGKKGKTTVDDLVRGLDHRVWNENLIRISKDNLLPKSCIVRVRWNKGGSHWVVRDNKWIYDPAVGKINLSDYLKLNDKIGKFSSYVELVPTDWKLSQKKRENRRMASEIKQSQSKQKKKQQWIITNKKQS